MPPTRQLAETQKRSGLETLAAERKPWLALFSRSGFSLRLRQLAEEQRPRRLLLLDLEALYQV